MNDDDAWTQLYAETRLPLLAFASRRARGADADAEDAVAETYARAIASIETYRPDRPVVCWLIGILRNVLREQARRGLEQPVWLLSSSAAEAADGVGADPLDHVVRNEEEGNVRVALDRLPADERKIVMLRVVEGWSSEEAGVATGRAPASVRMAQTRAMRRLRVLYAEAG